MRIGAFVSVTMPTSLSLHIELELYGLNIRDGGFPKVLRRVPSKLKQQIGMGQREQQELQLLELLLL